MASEGSSSGNGRAGGSASISTEPPAPTIGEVEALVRSLAGVLRDGGVTELDLMFGAISVRLRGGSRRQGHAEAERASAMAATAVEPPPVETQVVTAPMIGTYYTAPSPGSPPFIEVGDGVEVGQVIGIIEAMKIMNEIVSDWAGIVSELLVANGQPVEYGSPLIRLRSDDEA